MSYSNGLYFNGIYDNWSHRSKHDQDYINRVRQWNTDYFSGSYIHKEVSKKEPSVNNKLLLID